MAAAPQRLTLPFSRRFGATGRPRRRRAVAANIIRHDPHPRPSSRTGEGGVRSRRGPCARVLFGSGIAGRRLAQAIAFSPFVRTRLSSFSEAPSGFLSPRSHLLTMLLETLR